MWQEGFETGQVPQACSRGLTGCPRTGKDGGVFPGPRWWKARMVGFTGGVGSRGHTDAMVPRGMKGGQPIAIPIPRGKTTPPSSKDWGGTERRIEGTGEAAWREQSVMQVCQVPDADRTTLLSGW